MAGTLAAGSIGFNGAATAFASAPAGYQGTATASYLQVSGALGPQSVAEVDLFPSIATFDGDRLPRASASGANLAATLLGSFTVPDILSSISQSAGPAATAQAPASATLVPVSAAPLAEIAVSNASAATMWYDEQSTVCPEIGRPYAEGSTDIVRADLLEVASSTPAVTVNNATGGVAATRSTVEFIDALERGVRSVAKVQTVDTVLFGGTAAETKIALVGTFEVAAQVTGRPGGATTAVTWPIVTITLPNGDTVGPVMVKDLDPVVVPLSGTLSTVLGGATLGSIRIETGVLAHNEVAAKGTSASIAGAALLVELEVTVASVPVVVSSIELAPAEASAVVPVGGIRCGTPTTTTVVAPPTSVTTTTGVLSGSLNRTPDGSGSGTLAATGSGTPTLVAAAMILLAAGGVALVKRHELLHFEQ
jgi:LPXTG-motif cell wall-anchored protein